MGLLGLDCVPPLSLFLEDLAVTEVTLHRKPNIVHITLVNPNFKPLTVGPKTELKAITLQAVFKF
jgi:hypothetical protein